MSNAVLPVEVVNKVLSFMANQPYSQVAELIDEIKSSAQIVPDEVALNEDEKKEES